MAVDPRLDLLQREIEEHAILTIARRQPMAVDLREIVAAIRISADLERVGDLAKNIAKRAVVVTTEARLPRAIIGLKSMHEAAALFSSRTCSTPTPSRDIERARDVWTARRRARRAGQTACSAIFSPS